MFVQMCLYRCTWNNDLMHGYTRSPTLLHNNPNMFNLSPEHRKNFISLSQNIPKCSTWSAHEVFVDSYFFRFSVFCLSVYPSLHLSSTYLSIFPYARIYLSTVSPFDSIWLYITLCDSLGSISLSLQNPATCATGRSQFCTSQTIGSRAHTT